MQEIELQDEMKPAMLLIYLFVETWAHMQSRHPSLWLWWKMKLKHTAKPIKQSSSQAISASQRSSLNKVPPYFTFTYYSK